MAAIRPEHYPQLERWAKFVKENPTVWKPIHTQFINALFNKHQQFIEKLLKTEDGAKKIKQLYQKP